MNGIEKGPCFIVKSLRDEDCFSKCKDAFIVTHIFSKPNDQNIYNKILYADNKYPLINLSDDIKCKIDSELPRLKEVGVS